MNLTIMKPPRRRAAGPPSRGRAALVIAVCGAAALLLGTPTASTTPRWERVAAPSVPAGTLALVRAAVPCGSGWMLAGAVVQSGHSEPAAWVGGVGSWRASILHGGDYYSRRSVVGTAACDRGRAVLVGSRAGGAHGLPRTTTWMGTPTSLHAVPTAFEVFGGPDALSVSDLAADSNGFRLTGTRASGAAYWTSVEGGAFVLHDRVPGLASTSQRGTTGRALTAWHGGWVAVGGVQDQSDARQEAAAFVERDGSWRTILLTAPHSFAVAQRVVATNAGLIAAGMVGNRFVAWSSPDAARWTQPEELGVRWRDPTVAAQVRSLTEVDGLAVAVVDDGSRFSVWVRGSRWRRVDTPPLPTPGEGSDCLVSARGAQLLLVTVDRAGPTIWQLSAGELRRSG